MLQFHQGFTWGMKIVPLEWGLQWEHRCWCMIILRFFLLIFKLHTRVQVCTLTALAVDVAVNSPLAQMKQFSTVVWLSEFLLNSFWHLYHKRRCTGEYIHFSFWNRFVSTKHIQKTIFLKSFYELHICRYNIDLIKSSILTVAPSFG